MTENEKNKKRFGLRVLMLAMSCPEIKESVSGHALFALTPDAGSALLVT